MNSPRILRSLLLTTVKPLRKNIHTTVRYKAPEVWQPNSKGGSWEKGATEQKSPEYEAWEKQSFWTKVKGELQLFKIECKKFKEEMREIFKGPILTYRTGEVDVVWRFSEDPECLENWIVSCDSDNNEGYSSAKLELSPHGSGVFTGHLDMRVPDDGEITSAGYANIRTVDCTRSFGRASEMDWSPYTHLRMRVRGDGRIYMINIGIRQTFDVAWFEMYNFVLMTRGGPYWQDIRIPFCKFFKSHKGRTQDRQHPMEKNKIKNIGFTCADKIPGPFRLEIDYIGVECDNSWVEEFAYEAYKVDTMKL